MAVTGLLLACSWVTDVLLLGYRWAAGGLPVQWAACGLLLVLRAYKRALLTDISAPGIDIINSPQPAEYGR